MNSKLVQAKKVKKTDDVFTSDLYRKSVLEKIKKVTTVLKELADGQSVERLDFESEKEILFFDLFRSVNQHSEIFKEKIPKLQKCNIELADSVKELNEFKQNIGREEILEHAIINHMADAMFVTNLDGKVIIINETAKKILGRVSDNNLIGQEVFSFIEWRDRCGLKIKKNECPIIRAIKSGRSTQVPFCEGWCGVRKNGEIFPVRIYVSPVRLTGKIKAIVVVFHDATKESRIDEIKSDFISVASHQLRTPLAVATLNTEMLLAGHAGTLSEEQREYVEEIHFYNKKMADLLNVFLSVSKIEMDSFTLEYEQLSVDKILDDIIDDLSVNIDNRKIKIAKLYDNLLPKISGDERLLKVAIQNILANAVKYAPLRGRVKIETKLFGSQILIKIKDNGFGIPEVDKSRVFMKLYRGHNAKRNDSEGTGLGLYIAKSFIEKNGGQVWFDSKENLGTTFFVSLPIEQKNNPA